MGAWEWSGKNLQKKIIWNSPHFNFDWNIDSLIGFIRLPGFWLAQINHGQSPSSVRITMVGAETLYFCEGGEWNNNNYSAMYE